MRSVNRVIIPFDPKIRTEYENFMRHVFEVSSGFPEQGGGGAAALAHSLATGLNSVNDEASDCSGGEGAPEVAASDDDGDGDGDPDSDRRRPRSKSSHPSFPPALLAFEPLSHYVSFGRSRIYQLIAAGEFPQPIKVGKSSRWVKAEIDAWISKQATSQRVGA
jgi:predicted DNA-binding transcriptional regulator AlpA